MANYIIRLQAVNRLSNRLQYNFTEDQEKLEEEIKFTAQLHALNLSNKGNSASHPSISKYTNNPYQATSTFSFYNKLSGSRELGRFLILRNIQI